MAGRRRGRRPGRRVTFRRPASEVAYQRQRRDEFANEAPPPVPHLDVGKARVRPISRDVAKEVILRYEWLGTMAATSFHYGIFFGPFVAGVTCVGTTCTAGIFTHRQYGVERMELLTLARGACVHWAPPGTNSKLVSWTVRFLRKERRGKLVLAYADSDAGEVGTIYQAAGWSYVGRGASVVDWVSPKGEEFNQQLTHELADAKGRSSRWWARRLEEAGWTRQNSNPKYRYVCVVDRTDRALVERIAGMAQPYPKRGRVDTPRAANR